MIQSLIVPGFLNVVMLVLGIASAAAFGFISYRIFIKPALNVKADRDAPPPAEGWTMELVVDDQERQQTISIGQVDSTIKLRLQGLKEDQLMLRFVKDRGLEEYEITIDPGSNVFYRPPHGRKIEPIKSSESIASRELIGYNALFRVAATVKDNRPLQYVELELSSAYFFNNLGEEKMRFTFTITRIHPGLDESSRDKKGIFAWGRARAESDDAD